MSEELLEVKDKIITGNCLSELPKFAAESIDLIVTDPPYGLQFMGKDWDKAVPSVAVWKECLRVLKSGAFAFIMSSPRLDVLSQMAVRLSEAGFEIGFTPIYWAYASGFPKATNIAKKVDQKLGFKGSPVPRYIAPDGQKRNPDSHKPHPDVGNPSHEWGLKMSGFQVERTNVESSEAKALDGSYAGFQPKPAVEVIIVAMKPLSEKTYVEQALKNRKGITWLDEGRIPYENERERQEAISIESKAGIDIRGGRLKVEGADNRQKIFGHRGDYSEGRFPANLLVSDDVLNDGVERQTGDFEQRGQSANTIQPGGWETGNRNPKAFVGDSGSFSRYFSLDAWWGKKIKELPESVRKTFPFLIEPKTSKEERNKGLDDFEEKQATALRFNAQDDFEGRRSNNVKHRNDHPTVKPLTIMSYLITLGSKTNDIILDPFAGSGTTCMAARILNRRYIGIEINEEYAKIARARIKLHQEQMKLTEVVGSSAKENV